MKKILPFLSTNFDTIIALIISIVAAVYGLVGGNSTPILAGIATSLGIIAFGMIRDRLNREALSKQIAELKRTLPDRPSAMAFFKPMDSLQARIKMANQIDLCGVSLTNTININFPSFRERIQAGVDIRVMVIAPESQAIAMTSERSMNPKDTMYYQRRLESTFVELTYLHKYSCDLKQNSKKGTKVGNICVRLITYAPSFQIISLDSRKKEGVIQVEIFPHKFGFKNPPIFVLTPDNDKEWYTYFADQYEQMWKTATPWDPSPYVQKIPFEPNSSS